MYPGISSHTRHRGRTAAFTLVEAMVTLVILMSFFLASTATLNLFDTRAAKNRNAEAARALVDDYLNYLLSDNTPIPAVTTAGTDIDGDGVADGVPCTIINTRAVPSPLALIVTRTAPPISVVSGTLYWRVQAVGTAFGLKSNANLMQVNFTLVYTFRGQNYYYKAVTFKAGT